MKRGGYLRRKTPLKAKTGFKQKLTTPMKRSGFKRGGSKKLKKDLMPNRVKHAIKVLKEVSHSFVRRRDSHSRDEIRGLCFDCGTEAAGQHFQAGHWIPDSVGGILLRYHPHNMHGQSSGCNMKFVQERVKIDYTTAMIDRYGREHVDLLRSLKNRKEENGMSLRADIFFYEKLIELYRAGDEAAIVDYLHNYKYMP